MNFPAPGTRMSDICARCSRVIHPLHLAALVGSNNYADIVRRGNPATKSKPSDKKHAAHSVADGGVEGQGPPVAVNYARVLRKMVRQFNDWWKSFHDGMDIHFKFGEDDWKYLTPSEPAAARNELINIRLKALGVTSAITILDAFGGCGSDLITFLVDIEPSPSRIFSCDENEKKQALTQKNLQNFIEAWNDKYKGTPIDTDVTVAPISIKNLIYREDIVGAIDLMYLDPPWTLEKGQPEADGPGLVAWLQKHVFGRMEKDVLDVNMPKLIVIKTRFGEDVMKTLHIKDYLFIDTMDFTPFKSEVHFHFFQSEKCRTHHRYHPSEVYRKLYRAAAKSNQGGIANERYFVEYIKRENVDTHKWEGRPVREVKSSGDGVVAEEPGVVHGRKAPANAVGRGGFAAPRDNGSSKADTNKQEGNVKSSSVGIPKKPPAAAAVQGRNAPVNAVGRGGFAVLQDHGSSEEDESSGSDSD